MEGDGRGLEREINLLFLYLFYVYSMEEHANIYVCRYVLYIRVCEQGVCCR